MSITQMEELQEQDQTLQEEKSKSTGKRNPPARNTSRFWFERFLAVIQRQNPSVIDATFLSQIAPSNEGKLLAQLKFLHVIDEQGKPTQLLSMLNMVGDEQKKAFQEIAKGSYQDLLAEVKIDKAVPDDLVNFFIRKYAFTRDKGINAAKFFLYLTEKGAVQVSPELTGFFSEKSSTGSNQNGSSQTSVQKIAERVARAPQREVRVAPQVSNSRQLTQRKNGQTLSEELPVIQATISIKLDKDTPKEYWDRVLALLGERKSVELNVTTESESQKPDDVEEQVES
ncbi:MAG: DUF5343 domain-containing protein [Nitrososphaerales archaeon]|jgi:hypothetical protein